MTGNGALREQYSPDGHLLTVYTFVCLHRRVRKSG